jgi:hypothetical protein
MKKIIVGKLVEEAINGYCDWCGEKIEDKKQGFLSVLPLVCYFNTLENNFKLNWMKKETGEFGFFGKKFEDYELYWATKDMEYKLEKKEKRAIICKDCIKQLVKS